MSAVSPYLSRNRLIYYVHNTSSDSHKYSGLSILCITGLCWACVIRLRFSMHGQCFDAFASKWRVSTYRHRLLSSINQLQWNRQFMQIIFAQKRIGSVGSGRLPYCYVPIYRKRRPLYRISLLNFVVPTCSVW